jgi:hypothetical protein
LDLAKYESEVFLLGIWKNYDELEENMSMPEIFATLNAVRENNYDNRKFFAALKGIDLDESSGKNTTWEDIKARAFSGGLAKDSSDILALSGKNAQMEGFGIGQGLTYFNSDDSEWWKK